MGLIQNTNISLHNQKVETLYDTWPSPQLIISDGAYGVNGFKGDACTPTQLATWYQKHITAWSQKAKAGTSLWFWNTEIGWASVHALLEQAGWQYMACYIWNKGIQHIAGNCNLKTLKAYPLVTEVCVQYCKKPRFTINENTVGLKEWLRQEWERTGLPLAKANEACNLANAASRKYLTKDHLWYAPPPSHFDKLVTYANQFGKATSWPYFSVDGQQPMTSQTYAKLFPIFNGKYGHTNVWNIPSLHNKERIKIKNTKKALHLNQKPLKIMRLIIETTSNPKDVVWEPFGGLFSGSLAAYRLGRRAFGAECQAAIFNAGVRRFNFTQKRKNTLIPL